MATFSQQQVGSAHGHYNIWPMMSLILSIVGLFTIQKPERDHSVGHSWLCAQLLVALTLGNEGWGPLKFFLKKYIFMYFWLCWVLIAVQVFPQMWRVGASLQIQCVGFSLWWILLLQRFLNQGLNPGMRATHPEPPPPSLRGQRWGWGKGWHLYFQ